MDQDSLAVALALGAAVFMLMRMRKRRQSGAGDKPASTPPRGAASAPAMPRLGAPGTITYNQIQALSRNGFTPDKSWSREEAALILDAVTYLRAVCRTVAGDDDGPPPVEVQNALLVVVLTTEDVRDYVRKWGEERRARGLDEFASDEPELVRNNQFECVAKAARKYLTPAPAGAKAAKR
jgi:hypothetical protein